MDIHQIVVIQTDIFSNIITLFFILNLKKNEFNDVRVIAFYKNLHFDMICAEIYIKCANFEKTRILHAFGINIFVIFIKKPFLHLDILK